MGICWATNPCNRMSFKEILQKLDEIISSDVVEDYLQFDMEYRKVACESSSDKIVDEKENSTSKKEISCGPSEHLACTYP